MSFVQQQFCEDEQQWQRWDWIMLRCYDEGQYGHHYGSLFPVSSCIGEVLYIYPLKPFGMIIQAGQFENIELNQMFSWKNPAILLVVLLGLVASATTERDINVDPTDGRVLIEVYMESLCPYCQDLLTGPLATALKTKDIWKIAKFRLIPYGNAESKRQGNSYVFECQHGESECQGNIILSCATGIYGDQGLYFALCLESSKKNWNKDGAACAQKLNMDWSAIKKCTNSAWGKQRQYFYGLESNYINFKSVPYMLIDGSDKYSDYLNDNPIRTICLLYQGKEVINACLPYYNNLQK